MKVLFDHNFVKYLLFREGWGSKIWKNCKLLIILKMRLFQSIFSFKTQFLLYLKEESESVRMKQVSAFYEAENRVKIQKRIFKSYTARGAILWFF